MTSPKIIWMSDPHFTHQGDVLGHDPRVRLQAAVDHVNTHHSDAQACVISGDMVNRGTRADYQALQAILATLCVPVLPMVGNHDNRALLRETLPLPATCMADFIQYQVAVEGGLLVCLDTLKAGADAGEMCPSRRAWLDKTLRDAGDTPVTLVMHHPPMALGLPMQDSDRMEDGESLLDLVARYECVRYLCIGHVHRPITGVIRGIGFSTMRSVLYQAPPPVPDWDWSSFAPAAEAPALGVLSLQGADVTLQMEQICPYETGTSHPPTTPN